MDSRTGAPGVRHDRVVNVFCATHGIHNLPDVDAERLVYAYAAALTLSAAEVDRQYPATLLTAATMPTCQVEVLALVDEGAEFSETVRERVTARRLLTQARGWLR